MGTSWLECDARQFAVTLAATNLHRRRSRLSQLITAALHATHILVSGCRCGIKDGTSPIASNREEGAEGQMCHGVMCRGQPRLRDHHVLRGQGTHCVVGVPRLHPQLGQHPDAVGELHGLVEHVLALHRPLGDGEDVAALQLAGGSVWWWKESAINVSTSSLGHDMSYLPDLFD